MPLNTGPYLHKIFASGCFPFFPNFYVFRCISFSTAFSVTQSFYNDVLSNKSLMVIMALNVSSGCCRGPALQEEAGISTEIGISEKNPLFALLSLSFINDHYLDPQFAHLSFFLSSWRFRDLNLQFLTDKVKSISQKDRIQLSEISEAPEPGSQTWCGAHRKPVLWWNLNMALDDGLGNKIPSQAFIIPL